MGVCTSPVLAIRLYKPVLGKQVVKLVPRRVDVSIESLSAKYGKDNILQLPCGHCPSCLARRSKEWSIRCALESKDHKENCFLTLTYDNEHYKTRDVKKDWQKFIKSLRNSGIHCRYFGCCEAGDEGGRQHFHIILFGFFPKDVLPWAKSHSSCQLYTSKFLDSIWKKGLLTVQEFSPFAAQYVAGYVFKKIRLGDKSSFHFQSTRPGIGAAYALRNMEDIYQDDKLILEFGSHQFGVPKYFDRLAESLDLDLSDIKKKRCNLANKLAMANLRDHGLLHPEQMLVVQAESALTTYKKRRF